MTRRGFDRLAGPYRALEFAAFGGDLERARFAHLGQLRECRDILLLGEGDGRCAQRVAALAPLARVVCVDSSPAMIAKAAARNAAAAARVSFVRADAREFDAPPGSFDAVATLFFLDCFGAGDVERMADRAGAWMRPGALWLFADFAVPPDGLGRLRAKAWLALLYAFFRWEAGIDARGLPPSEAILARRGWRTVAAAEFQGGLLRSTVLKRDPGAVTAAPLASP